MGKKSQIETKKFKLIQNGWDGIFHCEICGKSQKFEEIYIQVPLCLCATCGTPWLVEQMKLRKFHPLFGTSIESSELKQNL